jgi:hypothetical protein
MTMTTNTLAAVAFSCALLTAASCAPTSPGAVGAGAGAPAIETNDDGDFGSDPDVGISIGSEPPVTESPVTEPPNTSVASEPGDSTQPTGAWFTYHICASLEYSCTNVRAAFCISQSDQEVRGRCRSHLLDSAVSWQNYCYNEFNAE